MLERDCSDTVDPISCIYCYSFIWRQIIKGRSEDDNDNNEMERGGKEIRIGKLKMLFVEERRLGNRTRMTLDYEAIKIKYIACLFSIITV
jgi:hypothetical protein